MADQKEFKLLPTGGDTFSEIITKNKYYVDKTSYLRSVFTEDGSSVLFNKRFIFRALHIIKDFLLK